MLVQNTDNQGFIILKINTIVRKRTICCTKMNNKFSFNWWKFFWSENWLIPKI